MQFRVWLESMEGIDQIYAKLSDLVEKAVDFWDARRKLEFLGMQLDNVKNNMATGQNIERDTNILYSWIGKPHEKVFDDKISERLETLHQEIGKLPNLQAEDMDAANPWWMLRIPSKDAKSNPVTDYKIHIKVPTNNIEILGQIGRLLSQNPENAYGFKWAVDSDSFSSRRDNTVIYLRRQGAENIATFRKEIEGLGVSTDIGKDFKDSFAGRKHNLSQTNVTAFRIIFMLYTKDKAPPIKYVRQDQVALLAKDPVVSQFAQILIKQGKLDPSILNDTAGGFEAKSTPANSNMGNSAPAQAYQPMTLRLSAAMKPLMMNIGSKIGSNLLKSHIGEEAKFFDNFYQFEIAKRPDGWQLIPNPSAANSTSVNGKPVLNPIRININDKIGIIGKKSGKAILPLMVAGV